MQTTLARALGLALFLAACGTASPGTTVTTVTTPEPTTTTTASATTTAPATTTTAPSTTTSASTSTTGSPVVDEADGSGCTPGTGPLPDGEWFGYVDTATEAQIEFDLACWFTGDAAVRAAAEDGEESPPPNDYYVRNVNETLRSVDVAESAEVVWYPEIGDPTSEATVAYSEWLAGIEERGPELMLGVWLEMENGEIVRIREQWVP